MGKRKLALTASAVLIIVALLSLVVRGLNFGIDFTGGTLIELGFKNTADLVQIRSSLATAGFNDATVLHFGTSRDVLIRLAPESGIKNEDIKLKILIALKTENEQPTLRRLEMVGPQVGDELAEDGGLAMLYALFGILLYVALRFEYRFALGSVTALVHDVIITLGIFSLFQIPFDLTILAAILAVIGYSLNDTIVVFDRIRENFRKMRKGEPIEIINNSLNQTLARTLMTSGTTLLVLVALFFVGGEIIHGFALSLIIGVLVGTYSSIYIASSTILALGISKADLMPVEKEGEIVDDQP